MKECCVEGCRGPPDPDPVFFEFPTSRLLRRRWLDILTVPRLTIDALVCSRHFDSQDYEMVRGKVRLKSKVLPSLHVGESKDSETEDTESQDAETITGDIIKTTDHDEITKRDSSQANTEVHNGNHEGVRNENAENDDGNVDKNIVNVENENKNVESVSENVKNDDENVVNDNKNVESVNENVKNDNDNIENDNKNVESVIGNVKNDNENVENVENDKEKIEKGNKKVENDNKNVENINQNAVNEKVKTLKRKIFKTGKVDKDNKRGANQKMVTLANGHMDSEDSTCSTDSPHQAPLPDKEDIEDSLTHYYIENKKTERQIAAMSETLQEDMKQAGGGDDDTDEVIFEDANPVFIEVSVGQEANASETATSDCLMLLESVQCDVDPALLLAARDPDADCELVDLSDDEPDPGPRKKPDTTEISLLTSSDEDDVIIQEPKIDTVTVSSDETDEDDVPLVKLVKTDPNQKKQGRIYRKLNKIGKILWGVNDFYCVQCGFTSSSKAFHLKHLKSHEKVLRVCQECGFTTCSEPQYIRHKRKHKNDKRFKCTQCNYSAKHSMSLVYHVRTHKNDGNDFEKGMEVSDNCVFIPTSVNIEKQHRRNTHKSDTQKSDDKKYNRYSCSFCHYWSKRKADLRRHNQNKHKDDVLTSEDDDDEYKP